MALCERLRRYLDDVETERRENARLRRENDRLRERTQQLRDALARECVTNGTKIVLLQERDQALCEALAQERALPRDEAPNVTCPICSRVFQADADCGGGDDLECPHCKSYLVVADVETRTFWRVLTLPDYLEREKVKT